jgi:hypothetical protein
MALTLKAEQRLRRVGLIGVFEGSADRWLAFAKQSYQYAKTNFPPDTIVRQDDVAEFLVPLLEVDNTLTDYLSTKKLTQKYWASYFGDLIIDRCWGQVTALAPEGA